MAEQQKGKFVAAPARQPGAGFCFAQGGEQVAVTAGIVESFGDALQEFIGAAWPQCFLDLAEAVNIDLQQGAGLLVALGMFHGPVEAVDQHAAVGQAGQHVDVGEAILIGFGRQCIADAQHELAFVHGFGQKVGRAHFQGFEFRRGIGRRGQHHDRQMLEAFVCAQLFEDLEATHMGHQQIEQDDVGAFTLDGFHGLARVAHQHEVGVSGVFEKHLDDLERDWLVIDHHDRGALHGVPRPVGMSGGRVLSACVGGVLCCHCFSQWRAHAGIPVR